MIISEKRYYFDGLTKYVLRLHFANGDKTAIIKKVSDTTAVGKVRYD